MILKNFLLLVFLSAFTFSCGQQKSVGKTKKDPDFENFKKFVKENWDYTYERGYVIPHNFFNELSGWKGEYNDELRKLDTLKVQKLFGIPRVKQVIYNGEIHWYYFRDKECIPFDKAYRCNFYAFEFKEDGKFKMVVSAIRSRDF